MQYASAKGKKVVYITEDFLAPDLALRLKNEGCEVMLCQKAETEILAGTIERYPYADRLDLAREADLVIFDDKSRGEADVLRAEGLSVIGGGKLTDKLELDRIWANKVAEACGMLVPEIKEFESLQEIKSFLEENGGRWVLKQQGKLDGIKGLNFVSKMDDSEDLIDYIDILESKWIPGVKQDFVIQEFVKGHEMACGSYWNGNEFQKDAEGDEICEENYEHKALFPGDLGESTGEQYTVMRYRKAKDSKLFKETLDRCRDILKRIEFRGDFDINCKVTEKGPYFLEFTPRMGVPAASAQIAIHKSSWYEFLKAMADGEQPKDFRYTPNYVIVSWLYTKPFPYVNSHRLNDLYDQMWEGKSPTKAEDINELLSFRLSNSDGIVVNFKEKLSRDDWDHVHMDGVKYENGALKIANSDGYVVTVTGEGETVDEAAEKVRTLLKKFVIPRAFWRDDFKHSHYHDSREDLTKWGYVSDPIDPEYEKSMNYEQALKGAREAGRSQARAEFKAELKTIKDRIKKTLYGNK